MDGIETIIITVKKNYFMVTIDLKDAYYSVSISRLFQKLVKLKWKDKLYCFTCFLGSCKKQPPEVFCETGLRPATLLKKRLWHRCFPVNFAKF